MTNQASTNDTQAIIVEYDLAHPPAKVWRALTDSKLVASWLMPNDLRPEVGHRFAFRVQPIPGWDGVCHCEVLEVRPNERLSYTWRGGSDDVPSGYGSPLDTVVTWTLTPTSSGGTLLRLVHSGFKPSNAYAFEMMGKGWRGKIAERITEVLASAND
jgi:uncharacterized protein YndB with AHSA1/START domain